MGDTWLDKGHCQVGSLRLRNPFENFVGLLLSVSSHVRPQWICEQRKSQHSFEGDPTSANISPPPNEGVDPIKSSH